MVLQPTAGSMAQALVPPTAGAQAQPLRVWVVAYHYSVVELVAACSVEHCQPDEPILPLRMCKDKIAGASRVLGIYCWLGDHWVHWVLQVLLYDIYDK